MHEEYRSCIEACDRCAVECEHCATACTQEPDANARAHCVTLLRDCADLCSLSSLFMARGSTMAQALCDLCARACDACGAECAKFKDEHCQKCAVECRRCAEECRKMAMATAHR